MNTRSKVLLTTAVAVSMVLGGAGTAYGTHFQDRALPGSALGGVSVAGMTRGQVAAAVRERADDVTVTLGTGTATRAEHLADLGYTVDVEATVDAVFAANESWSSYATSLVSSRDVDAVLRTDTAATERVAAELVGQAGKAGADASVKLARGGTSFVVVPAVQGKTVDRASFQDVVAGAARDLSSATTTVRFVDAVPEVTTAAAQRVADEANALVAHAVTVDDGEEDHTASSATKASWVTIPATDGTPGTPTVNVAKVQSWVDGVAKDAKVEPTSGVRNVGESGVRVVVKQAHDGKVVSNAAEVAEAATQALAAGRDYKGGFEYRKLPATWTDRRVATGAEHLAYPAAPGEKWVDVNLSRHTMTAYVGADVASGPIAMVNGAAETPTVVGTFHVYSKSRLMTMRGDNADGSRYETEDVPWVSFFHRGYALHGAPWRSTFGYTGSHGCVNLPVGAAKWVYDFAPIGTPVVTHF